MSLKLHSEGKVEHLKQLDEAEKKDLKAIKKMPIPQRLKEIIKIKSKYFRLKKNVNGNLYMNT